jgi:hypothetical protein
MSSIATDKPAPKDEVHPERKKECIDSLPKASDHFDSADDSEHGVKKNGKADSEDDDSLSGKSDQLDIADDSEDEDSDDDEDEDCEDDDSLPKASNHSDSADDSEDEESEDSTDDSEDEDSEGKMGAPECIHQFLRSIDAKVEELLRSNYRFHVNFLKKEIARAKRRIKMCKGGVARKRILAKNLYNKKWFLRHRLEVAKQEVCVANEWNIHALRYSKGEWVASVWTSLNKRESVPVEDAFVKAVIGPTNYKKRKFRSGEMIPLRKYDRMSEVWETEFQSISKRTEHEVDLYDCNGVVVRLTDRDAMEILDESVIEMANSSFQSGLLKKKIRLPSGALPHHQVNTEMNCQFHQQEAWAKDSPPAGSLASAGIEEKGPFSPVVVFRNGEVNSLKKFSTERVSHCLAYSLASALHYVGYPQEAFKFASEDVSDVKKIPDSLKGIFKSISGKKVGVRKFRINGEQFDPLDSSHQTENVIVACLMAKDSSGKGVHVNHCVAFVDRLIFDSNRSHAVGISRSSLDEICDSIISGAKYNGLYWSRAIILQTPRR